MPAKTKIDWADYISNPLKAVYETEPMPMIGDRKAMRKGWACVRVSPGCAHCWASTFNVRLGTGLEYSAQNMKKVLAWFDDKEIERIYKFSPKGPFKWGRERAVVFPCDMTDIFGDWVDENVIDAIFAAMGNRANVDWMVLTKRPERMMQYCTNRSLKRMDVFNNIYLGVSIEDQERANLRVRPMRMISNLGWKTWVSYEPALSNVIWSDWYFISWLVCGGESGTQARAMLPDWARSARDFCQAKHIPFFFKQWGEYAPIDALTWVTAETKFKRKPMMFANTVLVHVGKGLTGRLLDGREWNEVAK